MLPSAIKTLFKTYFDTFSFGYSNTQLNSIFEKANIVYWDKLANQMGLDWQANTDLQPIIKEFQVYPASNRIPTSSITEFDRLGNVYPTYVVNGTTYNSKSKYLNEVNNCSVYSQGTVRNPRHYLIDAYIILQPSNTPTVVNGTYLRNPYPIDFVTNVDVPITDKNVQGIIEIALRNCGVSIREFDYANQVDLDNNRNNQ